MRFFELLGDRVGDKLCVDLRLPDLLDIDVHHLHAKQLAQLRLEDFDVLALLADYDPGPRAVNGNACVLGGAFDDDPANRGICQFLFEVGANLEILIELPGEVLTVCEPA